MTFGSEKIGMHMGFGSDEMHMGTDLHGGGLLLLQHVEIALHRMKASFQVHTVVLTAGSRGVAGACTLPFTPMCTVTVNTS